MMDDKPLNPARLVDAKYPCIGRVQLLPNSTSAWYLHQLPNGRVGAAVWLYECDDIPDSRKWRTVIVREWNNAESPVYVKPNCYLGPQCSVVTNEFFAQIAALPPKTQAA